MLVDKDDANVLALRGKGLKGGLDGRCLGLGVNNEEVLLRVGRVCYVLEKRLMSLVTGGWFVGNTAKLAKLQRGQCLDATSCFAAHRRMRCRGQQKRGQVTESRWKPRTPMPASSKPVTESY